MRLITRVILVLFTVVLMLQCRGKEESPPAPPLTPEMKTLEFKSLDGLTITGDLYLNNSQSAPFIILFHQARFSRGEYVEIAPELVKMGFSCLAIDQRSGDSVNAVVNETYKLAKSKDMGTEYIHAIPDMLAALGFVQAEFQPETLIIWGSSYSASLSLIVANMESKAVDGIVAFSPGSYFELDGSSIATYAATLDCPVFMTSSQAEIESRNEIFEAIPSERKVFYKPDFEGYHGSKALWSQHEGHEKYWAALKPYLTQFLMP